jgi:hypothetical protein
MNKIEALARYILDKAGAMEFSKLSNIIYLADLEHYHREGRTISGARHYKREWGVEVEGLREVVNG